MHKSLLDKLQHLIVPIRIEEATGLNINDAIVLLQDFIDVKHPHGLRE